MSTLNRVSLFAIMAALCAAPKVQGQTPDTLQRDRQPTPVQRLVCRDCGGALGAGQVGVRIIASDKRVLFMAPADSSGLPARLGSKLSTIDPKSIQDIEVVKGITAAKEYGKAYASGLVIITLDARGTEAWLAADSLRRQVQ